ncbi:lipopolysaccharide biosynthesis protein [Alloyangia pacifica]|uniref:Membrane protein involved in the export of O-antigen and teichoic acid n=1 Tax=Alloyangia pacifica TaxID=311180 RepID=A0A1I6SA54_9RHOB|nr:lipopolysaccharide biosynthesis protein [Alloyangia pacifica]SDG74125.1 Membrane protein involved in the export of O-antigen and teichoic acid [Alloyangia pacifica]SFS73807.1 Membrane protein involved in the export of O-antigen and teichoic acid [Alloyangia pacifica]
MAFSPGKATSKNLFWAYLSFTSTKLLNFVAVIIIARHVDPEEFGLMAICLAIMGYFEIISKFGLGAALISVKHRQQETANAVFVCAIFTSSVMALLLWLGSGAIARLFESAELQPLLGTVCLVLVIRALGSVHYSLLFRELNLRKKMIPDMAQGITKGVISIILAIMGFGVWALVVGYIAGALVATLLLYWMRPWKPSALPDWPTVRYVMGFGSYLIGAETINASPRLLDNLMVGKFLGPAALGIYAIAYRIPELAIKSFISVAGTVLHPVMSKMQTHPEELAKYYYQSLRYCALLMFGIGAAIAVLAEPTVHVLYTEKWYDMVAPMQFIAAALAVSTLNMVPGQLLKAVSRTDLMFRAALVNLPIFVLLLAVAIPFGITAVAAAQLVMAFVRFVPIYLATKRVMSITLPRLLEALRPALICTGSASVAAFLALQMHTGSELLRLMAGAAAFAAVYLIALRVVLPGVFVAGHRFILKRRRA